MFTIALRLRSRKNASVTHVSWEGNAKGIHLSEKALNVALGVAKPEAKVFGAYGAARCDDSLPPAQRSNGASA